MIPVGFALQPEAAFLGLVEPLVHALCDYVEIAPETAWRVRDGRLQPNGFHARYLALGRAARCFFVGHGVRYSLGTAARSDVPRRRRWRERLAADHRLFRFRWYTDHLGATCLDGQNLTLPLPLPMDAHAARVVARRLAELRRIVPDVGVENSAAYFLLGDVREEPAFLRRAAGAPRTWLLLDVHNVYTTCVNFGLDPLQYVNALDLDRVIEIHVSGGATSDPAWLPSGRSLRLDSHDHAVPEPVWRLLEEVAPRCPNLRGITLERMEGTIGPADVPVLAEELERVRAIARRRRRRIAPPAKRPRASLPPGSAAAHARYEAILAASLRAPDPAAALARAARDRRTPAPLRERLRTASPDGVRLAALLVARLRYERLLHGDLDAGARFESDPAAFVEEFRAWHAAAPPRAFFPSEESALFRASGHHRPDPA